MFSTIGALIKNKEIRNRILFTFAMFFIFRFGMALTVPGVNTSDLMAGVQDNSFLSMMNLLGGGGIERLSIFALGVGPYITASIILQLLSMDVIPALTELSKSGASGKKKMDMYTRYLAVILGFIQAFTMIYAFNKQYPTLLERGGASQILFISTLLIGGTMFLIWIGDRISMKGIGNGLSMIIFAGIVGRLPNQFLDAYNSLVVGATGYNGYIKFGVFIVAYLLIVLFVIFMQIAERRIPIQYTSSAIQSSKQDMTYLPLKINSASVIPVIFASAVMVAPLQIASFFVSTGTRDTLTQFLGLQSWPSLAIYVLLILFFTFFYTRLQVDPEKIAENLGKSGTYIPGIRPGAETKTYISTVLNRITVLGAIGLSLIAVLPYALPLITTSFPKSMGIGGTGIIIVVGVAMETVKQLKGQLVQKSYKGFVSSTK